MTPPPCFSIRPWENVGFTDQLLQFDTFYKLGRSLGWNYRHLDFSNRRSSSAIYDFLGFNRYLRACCGGPAQPPEGAGFSADPLHDLALDDASLRRARVNSFDGLQAYIQDRANATKAGALDVPLILSLARGGSRRFFSWVQKSIIDLPDGLDLRSALFHHGRFQKGKSPFENRPVKLLVHIRLGDTASLKTPWHTQLSLLPGNLGTKALSETPESPNHDSVQLRDFLDAADTIRSCFPDGEVSTLFFSDGFGRLFDLAEKRRRQLKLSEEQILDLARLRRSYDHDQFREFEVFPNGHVFVGETDANLFALIESILEADLILIGRIQRMIPKFLAIYPNPGAPQKLLVLGNDHRHPRHDSLGLADGRKVSITGISLCGGDWRGKIGRAVGRPSC